MQDKQLWKWALVIFVGFFILAFFARFTRVEPPDAPQSTVVVQQPITRLQFELLHDGISYREACSLLGRPGVEISRSSFAGYVTVMYQWQNDNYSNMNAMFQNDRLVTKAQAGLK